MSTLKSACVLFTRVHGIAMKRNAKHFSVSELNFCFRTQLPFLNSTSVSEPEFKFRLFSIIADFQESYTKSLIADFQESYTKSLINS